jgi:hypothetical protein
MAALGKVDKIKNVFLEAASTEANGSLQEFGTNASVISDGVGHLVDIGTRGLADGRKGVNGGDALGKHGIGGELRKFRRPKSDSEEAVFANDTRH